MSLITTAISRLKRLIHVTPRLILNARLSSLLNKPRMTLKRRRPVCAPATTKPRPSWPEPRLKPPLNRLRQKGITLKKKSTIWPRVISSPRIWRTGRMKYAPSATTPRTTERRIQSRTLKILLTSPKCYTFTCSPFRGE